MRKLIIASVAAASLVCLPGVALAAKPAPGTHHTPTVTYVLRGTITSYTAASTSGSTTTNGSVSVTVRSSNMERKVLKGAALTFTVGSKTKVVLHDHKAIASGDRGIVKVRAPKGFDFTASTAETAFQVIDQGASR